MERRKTTVYLYQPARGEFFLQFIIKSYPEHKGVTKEIHTLDVGDELILHDVFGTITYQGKGLFIAGGAGITPFISIFRNLKIRIDLLATA